MQITALLAIFAYKTDVFENGRLHDVTYGWWRGFESSMNLHIRLWIRRWLL